MSEILEISDLRIQYNTMRKYFLWYNEFLTICDEYDRYKEIDAAWFDG